MKSCVLMAHVPDTASVIKVRGASNRIDETDIKWIVSPYDEYALEEAIRLKEARGGAVTVLTYGPERAQQGLRECLARGADAAVHVKGGDGTFGDALAIARVLVAAIGKVGPFDIPLPESRASAATTASGAMVAELRTPHVTGVVKLEIGDGRLTRTGRSRAASRSSRLLAVRRDGAQGPQRAALPVSQGDHGLEEGGHPDLCGGGSRARRGGAGGRGS
jgi:electron transfer flavoprotein beta subunit